MRALREAHTSFDTAGPDLLIAGADGRIGEVGLLRLMLVLKANLSSCQEIQQGEKT
jgi:hypothetical protein